MIFDCKASLSLPNSGVKFSRAKIAIGGHNGIHYIVVSFSSFKEKLNISNVTNIHQSKKGTGATITFSKPAKVLTVDASESGTELIPRFTRTIAALKKGEKKMAQAIPAIDSLEKQLKHQPKSLSVEGMNYEIKQLNNNQLERVQFTRTKLLPKGIFRLEFLRELYLTHCQLDEIPDRIVNLKGSLCVLDLSHNQISKFNPHLLCCLRQLRQLNLSHNRLTRLPLELVFLRSLLSLDVSYNQISRIPFTIGFLSHLRILNISHNSLHHFPDSILRPPLSSTKVQRLQLDSFDISGNERQSSLDISHPGGIREYSPSDCVSPRSPPSLFALGARSTMRWSLSLKLIYEWLPYTVYDHLQDNAAICSSCKSPCIAYRSRIISTSGLYSLLSQTVVTDASTHQIPVVAFYCCVCYSRRIE